MEKMLLDKNPRKNIYHNKIQTKFKSVLNNVYKKVASLNILL